MAFGGTLWQDIKTQLPQALEHVDTTVYERHVHPVDIVPGTHLAALYPGMHRTHIDAHTLDDRPFLLDFLQAARAGRSA